MDKSLGSTRDRRSALTSAFSCTSAFSLDSLPNRVVLRSIPMDMFRDMFTPAPACSARATGLGSSIEPRSAGKPPLPGDGKPPKDRPVGVMPAPASPPKNPPGDALPSPLMFRRDPPDAPNCPDAFNASVAALRDCRNCRERSPLAPP